MIVVFIANGEYEGFKDAILMAERFSGCRVVVIADKYKDCKTFTTIRDFESHNMIGKLHISVVRWLILAEFMRINGQFPVLCLDWDVLVFDNLNFTYEHLSKCDFASSTCRGAVSAAYGVNNQPALEAFYSVMMSRYHSDPKEASTWNDMDAWRLTKDTACLTSRNMYEIHNGSVFDHHIHETDGYEKDGDVKKIVWINRKPYFVLKETGELIKANTIHCWGSYKSKTGMLVDKATT